MNLAPEVDYEELIENWDWTFWDDEPEENEPPAYYIQEDDNVVSQAFYDRYQLNN